MAKKQDGPFEERYDNGQLKEEGTLKDGVRHGLCTSYFKSGELYSRITWKKGLRSGGLCEYYGRDGRLTGVGISQDSPPPMDQPTFEKWVDQNLENGLNDEQDAAVKAPPGNILVTARAGSGKTTVLTARAVWLQLECDVSPSELLLLAFNRGARSEMEKRLKPHFGEEMPHVMTFHALAHALVKPSADMLVDDWDPDQRALTRKIASIEDRLRPTLQDKIAELITRKAVLLRGLNFLSDALDSIWQGIQGGDIDLAGKDEERPSSLDTATLHGDYVSLKGDPIKSYGERVISDALFLNDVEAIYEHPFDWNGNPYKPDFTIKTGDDSGVVIEYFGMLGDPSYDEQAEAKRQYWKDKPDWSLIELTRSDVRRDQEEFTKFLLTTLEKYRIKWRELEDEEILEKSPKKLSLGPYTDPLTAFVATCRHKQWDPAKLRHEIGKHTTVDKDESFFLAIAEEVYSIYHVEVDGEKEEDFNALLWKAVSKVKGGYTQFTRSGGKEVGNLRTVRHILIDEFQDFSKPFHELIRAIQAVNPEARVFAVGDDWQAINRFAGSDVRFFENFENCFKDTHRYSLTTNYRSTSEIVKVSNKLMQGLEETGPPGVASTTDSGEVRFWNLDSWEPLDDEHDRNRLISVVLRLIKDHLDADRHVVMLSRTNEIGPMRLKRFEDAVRDRLPDDHGEKVTAFTTHKFKGCEEQAVIIIDANERRYPLVHPEWKFKRLFGETEERIVDDERRLFYVALTRAKTSLDIITNNDKKKSPFLGDIQGGVNYQSWERHPMLRVYTAGIGHDFKAVNEILKSTGFRFRGEPDNYWQKAIPATQLGDYSGLSNERWYQPGVRFEVISAPDKSLHEGECEGHPTVRVFNTALGGKFKYVNLVLKGEGFKYKDKPHKFWQKAIPATQLGDYSDLSIKTWCQPGVTFKVISAKEKLLHRGEYRLERCPDCKSGRVLSKTAKRGKNRGEQFYGCSEWKPNGEGCQYIRRK